MLNTGSSGRQMEIRHSVNSLLTSPGATDLSEFRSSVHPAGVRGQLCPVSVPGCGSGAVGQDGAGSQCACGRDELGQTCTSVHDSGRI